MSKIRSEAEARTLVEGFLAEMDRRINGTAKMTHSPEGIECMKAMREILAPKMREDPVLWASRIEEELENVMEGQPEEAG